MPEKLPFWLEPSLETGNEFVYYFIGSIGLVYIMCVSLSMSIRRKHARVIVPPLNEDIENENELHKYIIVIKTSLRPRSSLPTDAKVYIQIVGEGGRSKFNRIKIFSQDEFLLQRGNKDILMIRTKDDLGEIQKIKILIAGVPNVRWSAAEVEVVYLPTLQGYHVGYTLCVPHYGAGQDEMGIKETSHECPPPSWLKSLWFRLICHHLWLSAFNVPTRYGAYSSVTNIVMIFHSVILLSTLNFLLYILLQNNNESGHVSFQNAINYFWVEVTVVITILLEMLYCIAIYRTRSGKFGDDRHRRRVSRGAGVREPKREVSLTMENTLDDNSQLVLMSNSNMPRSMFTLASFPSLMSTRAHSLDKQRLFIPKESHSFASCFSQMFFEFQESTGAANFTFNTNQNATGMEDEDNPDKGAISNIMETTEGAKESFEMQRFDKTNNDPKTKAPATDEENESKNLFESVAETIVKTEDILISMEDSNNLPEVIIDGVAMDVPVRTEPEKEQVSHEGEPDDRKESLKKIIELSASCIEGVSSCLIQRHSSVLYHFRTCEDKVKAEVDGISQRLIKLLQELVCDTIDSEDAFFIRDDFLKFCMCSICEECTCALITQHRISGEAKMQMASRLNKIFFRYYTGVHKHRLHCFTAPEQHINSSSDRFCDTCIEETVRVFMHSCLQLCLAFENIRGDDMSFVYESYKTLRQENYTQGVEMLSNYIVLKSLGLEVVESAKEDIWHEMQDPVMVYIVTMVRHTILKAMCKHEDSKRLEAVVVEETFSAWAESLNLGINLRKPEEDESDEEDDDEDENSNDRRKNYFVESTLSKLLKSLKARKHNPSLGTHLTLLEKAALGLSERWGKEGFCPNIDADKQLAQTILTKICRFSLRHSLQTKALNNSSLLNSLETKLSKDIRATLNGVLVHQWPLVVDDYSSLAAIMDSVNILVEIAIKQLQTYLPSLAVDILRSEMLNQLANRVSEDVILGPVADVDVSENNLVASVSKATYDLETCSTASISGSRLSDTSSHNLITEIIEELRPLCDTYASVRHSRLPDIQRDLDILMKAKDTSEPQAYTTVLEEYASKYQDHEDLAIVKLQEILDSYQIRRASYSDKYLTDKYLHRVENDITRENRKPLPHFMKNLLLFWVISCTLFGLIYMGFVGAYFEVSHIEEWAAFFSIALLTYAFVVEPIGALIKSKFA